MGHKHTTSLLSEAQHRIVQVVFSGTPSGHETHEAPRPPISQSLNCFKDLPEIRDEPFDVISVDYLPVSNRSSLDDDMITAPVHVLSEIGPSTTYPPDYGCQAESSLSCSELSSAPSSRRRMTGNSGNRRYSALMRSRFFLGLRLDSIAEGDEPLSSSSMSSDIGDLRSCLNPIGPHISSLEITSSSSGGIYEEILTGQCPPCSSL